MAELLKLREADDPRDLIHRAVHRLVEGSLVVLPTENSHVVAAASLHAHAVEKLQALTSRTGALSRSESWQFPLLLGLKSADEARDYVGDVSPTGERLMHRLWPGPVVLALPVPAQYGLVRELPAASQNALLQKCTEEQCEVWFRVPAHPVIQGVMSLLPAPLILWEGDFSGDEGGFISPRASEVDLIIQEAPRHNQQRPTVVRLDGDSWHVVEQGIVTRTQINRMTGKVILFVCTGNTCRSPLAEGLCRKFLADRLGCSVEELPEKGYTVLSAGLAALEGGPAAPESVEVARMYGADLESHASQPLTDELLANADYVITMTQSHRDSILFARPDVAERVSLLSNLEADIADPIGGGWKEYVTCGEEIARHLQALLDQLEPLSDRDHPNPES
jgi:protein-tyrosine phosphatase